MTQIDGFGSRVNWSGMLAALQGLDKTEDVSGKSVEENLKLTNVPGLDNALANLGLPPLDAPNAPTFGNPAELQALLDKLEKDNGFKFSDEELKTATSSLQGLLSTVASKMAELEKSQNTSATKGGNAVNTPQGVSNDVPKTLTSASSKVMFDIYALMCLLIKCAQQEKNAHRDLRKAEISAVVTSIQNQAEKQKSAALTGLIAGSLICGLQAVAAGVCAYKTISNVKAEAQLSADMGVKGAATAANQAQTKLAADMAELKEFETQNPLPAQDVEPNPEVEQQRTELQDKVNQSKIDFHQKNQALKLAQTKMSHSEDFMRLKISEAKTKGFSDMSLALGNLAQNIVRGAVDIQQAEALAKSADQKWAEEDLAQTRDLMDSFQDVIAQVIKMAQAIIQAENDSMHSAIQA